MKIKQVKKKKETPEPTWVLNYRINCKTKTLINCRITYRQRLIIAYYLLYNWQVHVCSVRKIIVRSAGIVIAYLVHKSKAFMLRPLLKCIHSEIFAWCKKKIGHFNPFEQWNKFMQNAMQSNNNSSSSKKPCEKRTVSIWLIR